MGSFRAPHFFVMRKPLLFLLALASTSFSALADGLPPNVLKALKTAQIPAAHVAVVVQAVDAGQPLVAHNAAPAMNPASVMKLLTTYAALDLLGPAWTWKTSAWIENVAVDGRLEGNLYLKGSGDPRFAIEHLSGLLRQLRVRGIQQGSPAAQVGLLPDDRIIAVNRSRISSLAQLREAAKGQTSMLLQLRRGNQVLLLPLR